MEKVKTIDISVELYNKLNKKLNDLRGMFVDLQNEVEEINKLINLTEEDPN
jgi:hypothetical protein